MNLPLTIVTSKPYSFLGSDNKEVRMVEITGTAAGYGIFKFSVKENLVPDLLEGKTYDFEFQITADKFFKPKLKLVSVS